MHALHTAGELGLNDWCLAAGFVRNLAWDKMHEYTVPTVLNDIDLIYFNPSDTSIEKDAELECILRERSSHPWSVKNQARMHMRNGDKAYTSTEDAMSYWVEVETAVGARLGPLTHELEIVAPFGVGSLFENTITLNAKRKNQEISIRGLQQKTGVKSGRA